jgi:uncharacterized glyoxalase superfamily protein PhnB
MTEPAKNLPEGMQPLAPHLVVAGAAKAIEFYKKAFDAVEMMRLPMPDGKIIHAALRINGGVVMLVDEIPPMGNKSPTTLNGTPVTLHLMVANVDKAFDQAIGAGAKAIMPVADQFWGDRYGIVEDPFGHRWSIATPGKPMSQDEIMAAALRGMQQR